MTLSEIKEAVGVESFGLFLLRWLGLRTGSIIQVNEFIPVNELYKVQPDRLNLCGATFLSRVMVAPGRTMIMGTKATLLKTAGLWFDEQWENAEFISDCYIPFDRLRQEVLPL